MASTEITNGWVKTELGSLAAALAGAAPAAGLLLDRLDDGGRRARR